MLGRVNANLMLLWICLHSLRQRVKTRVQWSRKDYTNPRDVRQMLDVAWVLDTEEADLSLDDEVHKWEKPWNEEKI